MCFFQQLDEIPRSRDGVIAQLIDSATWIPFSGKTVENEAAGDAKKTTLWAALRAAN